MPRSLRTPDGAAAGRPNARHDAGPGPGDAATLRALLEHAPIGVALFDADLHYCRVNARAAALTGDRPEALIGRTFGEVAARHYGPYAAAEVVARFRHTLRTGEPFRLSAWPSFRPGGDEPAFADWEARRVPGSGDAPPGLLLTLADVTAHAAREAELRSGGERLRLALEAGRMGSWDHDLATGRFALSPGTEALFGLTPVAFGEDFDSFLACVHPDDRARVGRVVGDAVARGADHEADFRVVWPDGTVRWVNGRGRVLRDAAGRPARVVGLGVDVTERRAADAALRASEARFRQLADAMPQIVWAARPDGVLDYYNQKFFDYHGLTPDEARAPDCWHRLLHPDDLGPTLDRWGHAVRTGEPYEVEYRFRDRATGGYRWHLGRALPVRDAAGGVVRWFGTCTDIHDRKCAEEALREADRRKDEFLAMLAHELRNPLGPVRNAAEVLRVRPDAESVGWARGVVERQVTHLARLVDDLLDVGRISSGKVRLRPARVDLAGLVRSAADDHRAGLDAAGLALAVELPDAPAWVEGDPVRLAQVLDNLLANAAKFTDPGGRVAVRLAAGGDPPRAVVSVRDTGIGIEPALLGRVFDPFSQGDRSLDRGRGGLGLGLALVKGLAELHGGGVGVSSDGPGRGTEVTVWLPLAGAGPTPETPPPAARGPGRTVLIVEDNADAAESLRFLLEAHGHRATLSATGPAGVEAARRDPPEVVLCDLGLPGMDGFAVARALRADPATAGARLVALSGYGHDDDRRRSRESGFEQHLVKPVDPADLLRLLAAGRPA